VAAEKDADVRFYFDADILGLAHIVCALRPECTYPGDPGVKIKRQIRSPCIVENPRAKDREWIPVVGGQNWVAITRDKDIQSHLSLLQLVKEYRLRLVTLTGADAGAPWGQLGIVLPQWKNIESLVDKPGPIVVAATRTGFRHIDVDESIERLRVGREEGFRRRARRRPGGVQEALFDRPV
jgi:hypothetical protein